MKEVVRNISLDFSRRVNTKVVFASQADLNSRVFIFSLFDDGKPYEAEAGTTASINVCRPDGSNTAYYANISADGTVRYLAGSWTLGIAGETKVSVSLYDPQKRRLTTCPFIIDVAKGVYVGKNIEENDEAQILLTQLMTLVSEVNASEEQRVLAENVRCDDEASRLENEASRNLQEAWRIERENIRNQNEEARCLITDAIATAIDNLLLIQENLM